MIAPRWGADRRCGVVPASEGLRPQRRESIALARVGTRNQSSPPPDDKKNSRARKNAPHSGCLLTYRMATANELTLDPVGAAGWDHFRSLAHRMVDDMLDHLSTLREQPAWRPLPDAVRRALTTDPLPLDGKGAEAAYRDFEAHVLRYTTGNVHPRFWG